MIRNIFFKIHSLILNILDHDVFTRSAALAYYLIFSIFPSLLLLYSVMGFFDIDWSGVLFDFKNFIPKDIYSIFSNYIDYLTPKYDLMFLLSGLFAAVYSSYKSVKCIKRGISIAYKSNKCRSTIKEFIRSILFTLLLYVAIFLNYLISPLITGIIDVLSSHFLVSQSIVFVWHILKTLLGIVPVFLCLSLLYHFTPCEKYPFRTVVPGSLFSTLGIYFSAGILNLGTISVLRYSKTYGSLAIIIVFIFWLYIISFIVLVGGEISALFAHETNNKKIFLKKRLIWRK